MPLYDIFQKSKDEEHEKPKISIIADYREKNSLVISELISLGIQVNFEQLQVGDFLVNDVAIERKTVSDFINSMINKRLARQLEEIKQYPKQLLIIEGIQEEELYDDKNKGMNANAVRGFLLSILLQFQVPIIFAKNYADTAKFIAVLARKEERPETGLRAKRRTFNSKEQMQFILEGFPGIGPSTAKKLLKEFKSIKNILNASEEELKKSAGKKADIFKLASEEY